MVYLLLSLLVASEYPKITANQLSIPALLPLFTMTRFDALEIQAYTFVADKNSYTSQGRAPKHNKNIQSKKIMVKLRQLRAHQGPGSSSNKITLAFRMMGGRDSCCCGS